MPLTNRWFIEKEYLDIWSDWFNPESGYETKSQAEQYVPIHIKIPFRVVEKSVEFPVKRSVFLGSVTTVTELYIDSNLYRKTQVNSTVKWEFSYDDRYSWEEPFLEESELERALSSVLTSQT